MAQTIKLKRSATAGNVPGTSDLALGELAINTTDGAIYMKKSVSGTESIEHINRGKVFLTQSENPPSSPQVGDMWRSIANDATALGTFIYYENSDGTAQWVEI